VNNTVQYHMAYKLCPLMHMINTSWALSYLNNTVASVTS